MIDAQLLYFQKRGSEANLYFIAAIINSGKNQTVSVEMKRNGGRTISLQEGELNI